MLRCIAMVALLFGSAVGSGCGLDVRLFAGTIMEFTVANAGMTPVGEHLELWARDPYDDILRIDPFYHESAHQSAYGLMIRQAISLDDPCIIDDAGHLLTDASAYPTTVTTAGVSQTPAEQALAVVQRIVQLAPAQQPPLLAVLPWDTTPPPSLPPDATPAERLAACTAYEDASDRAYVANPLQITAPAHGAVFGFIRFISTEPAENYDGFRLDTPVRLQGVQEILLHARGRHRRPQPSRAAAHDLAARAGWARRRALRFDSRRSERHRVGWRVVLRRPQLRPGLVLMRKRECMNGLRFVAAVSCLAASALLPACNMPSCGPGTQQVQQADGSLRCLPADGLPASVNCDVDGGAVIIGGQCVSAVTCGANTALNPASGQCEATGNGGGIPACSSPMPGRACVNGALFSFLDSTPFTGMVHVSVYDPFTLLSNGAPLDSGDFMGGGYLFPNITAPGLGLIAIVVGDANGSNTTFVNCATGDQMVTNGNEYRVDAYVLPRAVTDGWKSASNFDIGPAGAYIAKFYSDTKEPPTSQIADEKSPVAGVQLTEDSAAVAGVRYFDTSLGTISASATATSSVGAAILAAPVSGSFPTFSGTGPASMPVTWEANPGGSAPGLVFVTRFHPN